MSLFKRLQREWRTTEIRLLTYALVVAITAVTSVGFFTDRIDHAMRTQATALFGADLVVQSTRPISEKYGQMANKLGLHTAATIEFPSVVLAGDDSLLVQIKAISSAYPLRGSLETTDDINIAGKASKTRLPENEVWVEANVLHRLGIAIGDSLNVGSKSFTVARVVTFAADNGGSLFQLAPKVLLPLNSLADTELLSPASRATYRFLAAGENSAVEALQSSLEDSLSNAESLQTAEEGRPEVNNALNRATRFMSLATILTIVLAGVAVALATISFTRQEALNIAVYKSLGFTRRRLVKTYLRRLALLVLFTTLIGSLLGFIAQYFLASLLSGWLQIPLPSAGPRPLLAGLLTGLLTLGGFGYPALSKLINTPPARILRSENDNAQTKLSVSAISSSLAAWLFLIWQAQDITLATLVLLGVIAALACLLFIAQGVTGMLRRLPLSRGTGWRLGIRNVGRYRQRSALLIAAFGISVLTLMLLSSVRQDLMQAWQASVPENAPNHFLINIQPQDLEPVDRFLSERDSGDYQLYPMIRGRLLAINDKPVSSDDYTETRAKRLVSREFNLSTSDQLPTANKVIEGDWQRSVAQDELSVESGIAETLGFGIGDQLTFDVAGERFSRTIGNLRQVNWDSMQPNFFVIVPSKVAADLPATYITSLHVDNDDTRFTADLIRQFPGITVLDVRSILHQVRRIISQASAAVQYVFIFTILAGMVVLLAAVQTQRHERRREIAILKTLGARGIQLQQAVLTEFGLIGVLAGAVGGLLATGIGWLLASKIFDLTYDARLWPVLLAIVLAGSILMGLGYRTVGRLLKTQPVDLLR